MKMWVKSAVLLAGLVLATAAPALAIGQDKTPEKKLGPAGVPKGQRIFVCGHSLHWYIPTPLGELAAAAGIKDHKLVGTQSLGASKTLQHWNLAEGKNKAKQALKKGDVDVFTMSPIQFPDEGIENFVKLGLEHNPSMRFTVQISWGGGDIDNQDFPKGAFGGKADWNKTPDQLKNLFQRNIKAAEAQADDLNKKYGKGKKVVLLVPSAQANIAIRTKIANKGLPGLTRQDELFRDPISHPTAPLEAVNTYLHFAVIYNQSPVGLAMPSLLKNAKKKAWDEQFNRTLQELAWDTVTSYPYSGVAVVQPQKGDKKTAGQIGKRIYEFKETGKSIEYALFVPSKYAKDQKTPLVVALHGLGGNPQQMIRSKGLTEQAEKYGYIVAAPMGYNSSGWYGAKGPGGIGKGKGKGKDAPENLRELSEKDVMNVLELVRKEFAVDEKRIYLIGHSMGGAGTWHLGTKYPDIWAGLAPIAPAAFGQPTGLEKIKQIPVIVVQGDKDTLVRPEGTRRWVEKMKELKMTHEYLEIAGGGHGDVIGTGMPRIFEFFEKQHKKEDKGR